MKLMKIFLILISCFALTSNAFASVEGSISATQTEAKTDIDKKHLILVNDGTDEVFIELNRIGEDQVDATTSAFELKSGESATFDSDIGFNSVSTICNAAETATVRYIAWD